MGRTRVIQHSLNGGILSPTAYGRVDIQKYYTSIADGLNTICHPHGGQFERGGFKYVATLAGDGRLVRFAFNVSQTYILVFTDLNVAIYEADTEAFVQNVVTTYSLAEVKEFGYTQSADTMIITHKDHTPRTLTRDSGTGVWSISDITLTNVPVYDYGSGDEPVVSATRGWPKFCTFFESRLWLAGLKSRPQTIIASKTNDFYNLDIGTSLADEAIFDTLDTDQINPIVNIFPGRQLQIFTEGGEFSNTSSPITPEDSSWTRHTNYGSRAGIRPIVLDNATMFIDRSGRNLREFLYNFTEDGYNAGSVSTLAYDIIKSPVDITFINGTEEDISNLVLLVNLDGTIAVFNTLRSEEVAGWTRWNTNGLFKSIESVYDELYVIVSRDNGYFLERRVTDVFTDSNVSYGAGGPVITGLSHLEGQEVQIVADGNVMTPKTVTGGQITTDRTFNEAQVGLGYNTKVQLLPISPNLGGGSSVNREKRILKTTIRVHNTKQAIVNGVTVSFRQFGTAQFDGQIQEFTGIKEVRNLGYGRLKDVTIEANNPTQFRLLMVEQEVSTK